MARVKTLSINHPLAKKLSYFPSFDKSGSVRGMKKLYYGKNALLVKCGKYIYNVTSDPYIYYEAH